MYIENNDLRLVVNDNGGTLSSIFDKRRSRELLYQPQPDSWKGQDIFIFPIIHLLKDHYYTYQGKRYEMKSHGLFRYMKAKERKDGNDLIETFVSDSDTLRQYPFEFEANLRYHLENNVISLFYTIENKGSGPMPFCMGAHPAFRLPGRRGTTMFHISENYIEFPKKVNLRRVILSPEEGFVMGEEDFASVKRVQLHKDYFRRYGTLVFRADDFSSVKLIKRDHSITMNFYDAPYLVFWSDPNFGDFLCIEPWNGLPDALDADHDILKKHPMHLLAPKDIFHYHYDLIID